MIRSLLNAMLYFPGRQIIDTPRQAELEYRELVLSTNDGERLHGWWIGSQARALAHLLLCHGNAGNIGDRVLHAALLTAVGFDVLLFRLSRLRPQQLQAQRGGHLSRRARRALLPARPARGGPRARLLPRRVARRRVALDLALDRQPAGLVLVSTFTGIRELGRAHYPFIPTGLIPDAYPTLRRIHALRAPLLVLHGERDEIVPLSHGRALFDAAPKPRHIHVCPGLGHNDLVGRGGAEFAGVFASWASGLQRPQPTSCGSINRSPRRAPAASAAPPSVRSRGRCC